MRLLSSLVLAPMLGLAAMVALTAADLPKMVKIEAADCPIGATRSHEAVHKPKVGPFWIAQTPITNAQYLDFVAVTGHRPPDRTSLNSNYRLWNGAQFPPEIADQPVVNVSWTDAVAYCQWLAKSTGSSFRLPAEEEWEIAARAGDNKKPYPSADTVDLQSAWFGRKWNGNATLKAADYGRPNAFGLFGMAGNAWQWVEDWYVPVFDDRPVTEELRLYRVLRGGSWANEADFLKVNYRNFHPPEFRDLFTGFRVAR